MFASIFELFLYWFWLYKASSNGHQAIVQYLVEHGANINANEYGNTALHMGELKNITLFRKLI